MRGGGGEPVAARAGMAEGGSGSSGSPGSLRPGLPGARGVLGRRPAAPTVSPGRLPSIRSRDLTLGGVKKKTFTPNIIVRKVKEEPREDVSVKKEKKERERQRDGQGRGRGRPEVIQSHSIFEQGPAEMMKKKAGSWDKTVDVSDFGPSHIINIKKEKRETDEETKQILRMLQKDDFLDDPGLKNDIRNKPVQLPLAHSGWLFKDEAAEQEDTEPWLPGQSPGMIPIPLSPWQEAKQAENTCTLADLPEGQVGKLLIRKSGKVQLVLGKVTLDVTMGTPCSFLQELVSVGIGDNRTGEMIVLGHVRHKLVCSPDFEALLEHRHR
ncbi:DNA-directed RNA polymerase III subunit RPC4 [Malurus melanocephalus]|uniref:DNA-directed RNA polymerase III subunit RPC4 n=1 Tax=Malurus melanocephalus TaxID=175006 RepID=UPI002546A820|nr:DNA-directed RNA polymerase III subunit RPC4 [Malurus melanocephalus]